MLSALNETTMKTEMSMVVAMMLMSIVSIPGRAVKSSILQQLQWKSVTYATAVAEKNNCWGRPSKVAQLCSMSTAREELEHHC